ncbi:MAG: hypothetical protein GTN70_05105 [Deltaproteobacteria bacterium]|nr:hypothetical protein [Deltaproteobacteria bacterium]NIS77056.1 hypothetical protein [Deltaproteobacteria bacterium]
MRRVVPTALVAAFLFLATLSHGVERIVILPFDSLSKDDISFIQGVVPKLLSSRLAEMTGLDTVTAEVASPDEALVTYGPSYLVSGSVTKLGSTYSLDIIVHDPSGEKVGGYFSSAQDENGILASLEGLAKDVAKALPGAAPAQEAEAELPELPGETEAPVQATGKDGPPVLPAEEPPAEKVAALKPGSASEIKAVFTEIKKIENLGVLPGEIYRVAAADIDGDGLIEIAFMGKRKIFLYRFKDGQIHPIKTIEKGRGNHFLNVDVFDVDGDGLEDFVVTDLITEFLRSFVIGKKDDRIGIKIEGISWYLAVFDDYKGQRVLVGQKTGAESPYSDMAYVLTWDGKDLVKGENFNVPRNEELQMGILNMNAFMDDGKQRFVLMDQYEKIRAVDENGRIFWKSADYYSGALDFFEIPSENIGADGRLRRYYVNSRLEKVNGKVKTMFLVREAPRPLLGDMRSYSKSRLVLVEWDGNGFSKSVEGMEEPNLITDFSLLSYQENNIFIVASVITSKQKAFSEGRSKVVMLSLE